MIIECVNCGKKFKLNSDLIPEEGRTIQCGSCDHIWFYQKSVEKIEKDPQIIIKKRPATIEKDNNSKKSNNKSDNITQKEKKMMIVANTKQSLRFSKILSYVLVLIISFIALIIIIDTFKSLIFTSLPQLEIIFFNLFETFKDISLFIKDLI
tara:strand:- start:195 stop:650 length:456 start_codon:yes stop_codon:yes gene_type:complete